MLLCFFLKLVVVMFALFACLRIVLDCLFVLSVFALPMAYVLCWAVAVCCCCRCDVCFVRAGCRLCVCVCVAVCLF